jgi:hypothetical protein
MVGRRWQSIEEIIEWPDDVVQSIEGIIEWSDDVVQSNIIVAVFLSF